MSDIFGQARLAKNPELKYVGQGDDKQPVCELRVRMLNSKPKKNTDDEWQDNGFWAQVSLWGKFAEPASKLFQKGDRIYVTGDLVQKIWPDENDATIEHNVLDINSNAIFPYLPDLESLRFKPRKSKENETTTDE